MGISSVGMSPDDDCSEFSGVSRVGQVGRVPLAPLRWGAIEQSDRIFFIFAIFYIGLYIIFVYSGTAVATQ